MTDPAEHTTTPADAATTEPVWSMGLAIAMLAFWFLTMFLVQILSLQVAVLLRVGGDEGAMREELAAMAASPMFPVGVALCVLLSWIVTLGVIDMMFKAHPRELFHRAMGLRLPMPAWSLALAVPLGIGLCFAGLGIAEALRASEEPSGYEVFMKTVPGRLSVVFMALFLAPPAEEIFFRGFLYPPMARIAPVPVAVIANALVFTLPHIGAYRLQLAYLLPVMLLGLVTASLRAWTGSVYPSIAAHFIFNGSFLTLYFFFNV